MTTTAWPTTPAPEFISFAFDGWSILRIGRTDHLPLTYEASHPEFTPNGNLLVAHSLGEVRDLIDMHRELVEEQAQEAEAAAYAAWEAEQDARCPATRHAGSMSDPYVIGCDLPADHDGAHVVTDPLGPDTGTWTWTRTSRFTLKDA